MAPPSRKPGLPHTKDLEYPFLTPHVEYRFSFPVSKYWLRLSPFKPARRKHWFLLGVLRLSPSETIPFFFFFELAFFGQLARLGLPSFVEVVCWAAVRDRRLLTKRIFLFSFTEFSSPPEALLQNAHVPPPWKAERWETLM